MSDFLSARRARLAAALPLDDAILLVGAGLPVPLPEGSDQTCPFRSHAEYYYLTGRECAGGVAAFDPRDRNTRDGGWVAFAPEVTEGERVWEGRTLTPGTPLAALDAWLAARRGHPVAILGAPLRTVAADDPLTQRTREQLTHTPAGRRTPRNSPCSGAPPRRPRPATQNFPA